MKLLKQNQHGLPGIGVSGQVGQTGENGKSVYFGFINDFFDGTKIDVTTYIYAAKRALQSENIDNEQQINETKDLLHTLISQEIQMYDISDDDCSSFKNYSNYINNIDSNAQYAPYINYDILYYTGNRLINSEVVPSDMKNCFDSSFYKRADALKLDVNGEFLQMSFMVASALDQNNSSVINGFKGYNFEEDYTPNIDLSESLDISNNIIYNNITNEITHYAFTNQGSIKLDTNKTYEVIENNVSNLYTKNTITFDTIDAIYNNSSIAAEEYAKGNILNNLEYYNYYYPTNSSITYIKEDISTNIDNPNSYLYALDGNSYLTSFSFMNYEDQPTPSVSDIFNINIYPNRQYFSSNYEFSYRWNEIFKTSIAINSEDKNYGLIYENGDLQDENKKSFYGVPPRSLFIDDGNSNIIINRNGDVSSFLKKFPKYYNNNSEYYLDHTQTLVSVQTQAGTQVYYSLNDDDTYISIPMSLKSNIKPGDIIYFYTNKDEFIFKGYNINYMVIITEDLINCTPKQLIESAILTDPLNITFFAKNQNRIYNFHNEAILKNDNINDISLNKLSNKSYISIVDKYTTSTTLLSSKKDFLTSISYHNIHNAQQIKSLTNSIDTINNQFIMQTDSILKTENLCVNQDKISSVTNIELSKMIYNSNIILYDNYFIKPLTDINLYYDNNNEYASIFIENIDGRDYFKNIEKLNNYFYGCDIYNKDMEKINTITSNTETLSVEIIPTIDNKIYYIQMFASYGTGLKYYSKFTKLTVVYKPFNFINEIKKMEIATGYNKSVGKYSKKEIYESPIGKYSKDIKGTIIKHQLESFSLEIIGDDQNVIKQKYSENIIFNTSDITAEKISGAILNVYSNNDDIDIIDVMFNNTLYTNELNINNWSNITKIGDFKYLIDMSTNLPIFNSSISNSLNDYIITGNEYLNTGESCLFNMLLTNSMPKPTKQRSILVTAKYKFKNSNEIYYENYNLIQPGFTDTRNVPNIDLDIHSNIIDLESFNNLNNGVLSNQFITYLDVNISKFKEYWEKFSSDTTKILMDIELRNLQYDFDWQNNYVVKDLYARRTFRDINEYNKDVSILNNYIKTYIQPIKNYTNDNINIDISLNSYLYKNDTSYPLSFISNCSYIDLNNDNNKYILFNSSTFNNIVDSSLIYNGLQNDIVINLNNINLNNDLNKIRLKILTEIGNPIISNIYYRFYVKNITIKVINCHESTETLITEFKTHVPDSINENIGETYLCQIDTQELTNIINVNYKYISEPLDVMFNPISYTVCPNNIEYTYTNIYGDNIYKYGIHEQIIKELYFFNNNVYTSNDYVLKDKITIRDNKLYDYINLNIKKSYIQDNVKNINVKPISLYDIIQNISTNENKSLMIDSSLIENSSNHYILDFIEGNKYLSISYHSTLLQPKLRNNQYTFFYNDKEYQRTKYDQKINNLPIFAYDEQSIELRDDNLIFSIDKLNNWYAENRETQNKNTYQGVLSLYGNGYTQINNDQFENYQLLNEVIKMNNENITTYVQSSEVNIDPMKQNQPNKDEYLRGFLYDINWEFPYYDNHNIIPYRIVSPFDNLLNNIAVNGEIQGDASIYQDYYDALIEKNNSNKLYSTHMIPYTLLYNIYPRIAYNYDNNKINVFMLRRPSVGMDTDIIDGSTFNEKYEFNRRLFNLTNFEKLKSPYEIK